LARALKITRQKNTEKDSLLNIIKEEADEENNEK
jgi:hypothetical protein